MYRPIDVLKSHFAVDSLLDLLYDDSIREQISHLRFFYRGKERHINKEGDQYWCAYFGRNGDWVKDTLTEQVFNEFLILEHEWRKLSNIPDDPFDEIRETVEEELNGYTKEKPEDSSSDLMAIAFVTAVVSITGCHVYRMWKNR